MIQYVLLAAVSASILSISYAESICEKCVCKNETNGFLVDCKNSGIDNDNLQNLTIPANVTSLILDGTSLKLNTMLFDSFNLTNLKLLSLKFLKGKTGVANWTFANLRNLEDLSLAGTHLLNVEIAAFANLTALQSLDLSSTDLTTIPNLLANVGLRNLYLANNKLTVVELGKCCPLLEDVILSTNHISYLDNTSFSTTQNLTKVLLNENQIRSISNDSFTPLQKLQAVDFSKNPIDNTVLNNILAGLGDSVGSLKLSGTLINGLPDGAFKRLTKLTFLDLSNTFIRNVTSNTFEQLKALTELYLQNASIANIDAAAFANMAKLKTLKLGANQLESLPSGIFSDLASLTSLDISGQSLSVMPLSVLAHSRLLDKLNLANNALGKLIASDVNGTLLANLANLTELHLQGNLISTIPANFFGLSSAKGDVGLSQLAHINLQENALSTWSDRLFSPLSGLRQLNLSVNQIELITSDTIYGFPNTSFQLSLLGNAWVCNCSLLWFREWLNASRESLLPNITVTDWPQFICGPKSMPPLANIPFANFQNNSINCAPQPPTPTPTPTTPVQSNSFLYGVIVFAFVATLMISLAGVSLYRYDIAIWLHLIRLHKENKHQSGARLPELGGSRDSLLRTSESGYVRFDRSLTHDVYVVYADNETDRKWVHDSLNKRLNEESYMMRECYPRDLPFTCGWFQRLSRIDECANVLIVVSDKLESRQHPGLLQLDIRYVFDRAERLSDRFKPPIVVQRGAFCSCGIRQRLPRRLIAQVHCETCRMLGGGNPGRPNTNAQQASTSAQKRDTNAGRAEAGRRSMAALRWPETHIEEDANDFWNSLKEALGPPIVVAEVDMNTIRPNVARSNAEPLVVPVVLGSANDPNGQL